MFISFYHIYWIHWYTDILNWEENMNVVTVCIKTGNVSICESACMNKRCEWIYSYSPTFLFEIVSCKGSAKKCSVWARAAVSGELYNYCWACSVWQWGLGCLAQAAQSPNCHHRLVPDAGLTTVMIRCKWTACSGAKGGCLKCDEKVMISACTHTRTWEYMPLCKTSIFLRSNSSEALSPLLTKWRSAVSEKGEGRRPLKEGGATDLLQEDMHLCICSYSVNGWRQGSVRLSRVCVWMRHFWNLSYLTLDCVAVTTCALNRHRKHTHTHAAHFHYALNNLLSV